ncbi:plastocyanin [Streptomyces albidoflavus]
MGSDRSAYAFVPSHLTVNPGATIKWVCNKMPPHNVVFDPEQIPGNDKDRAKELSRRTLLMTPGHTSSTTIPLDATPGDYHFYCQPHRGAGETGTITVSSEPLS